MNRVDIKEKARNIIKDRLWDLWKPTLIVMIISAAISVLVGSLDPNGINQKVTALSLFLEIFMYPLSVGLAGYYLKFIRGKKYKLENIWDYYKNMWPIILICFLVALFTALWTVLFVIPGIIAALAYSQVMYLMADGELNGTNTIRKSVDMMNGYKWDYFVFQLSFILWILLVPLTFGIILIYLVPYISTCNALYYEELRKLKKIKA